MPITVSISLLATQDTVLGGSQITPGLSGSPGLALRPPKFRCSGSFWQKARKEEAEPLQACPTGCEAELHGMHQTTEMCLPRYNNYLSA